VSPADPVLEQCAPADLVPRGEVEIGKGEPDQVGDGLFGRTIGTSRPRRLECRVEHRQRARTDGEDELVQMLEDVVDRADRASRLGSEVARLQCGEPAFGYGALGGVD